MTNKVRAGGAWVDVLPWSRPADWLAMPAMPTEGFVGLLAITPDDTNYVALKASGAYTVNWGDGNTENIANNTKAEHHYDYASILSGTNCSRDYRQVVVSVTPQVPGALTKIDLMQYHSTGSGVYQGKNTQWLDVEMAGPALATVIVNEPNNAGPLATVLNSLERIRFGANAITNGALMFAWDSQPYPQLGRLAVVSGVMPALTDATGMFQSSNSLMVVDFADLSALVTAVSMMASCNSLQRALLPDLPVCTDLTSICSPCPALREFRVGDLPLLVTMTTALYSCGALDSAVFGDMPSLTGASSVFDSDFALRYVEFGDTPLLADISNLLWPTYALQKAVFGDLSGVTNAATAFGNPPDQPQGALVSLSVPGLTESIDISYTKMDAAALAAVFADLGTVSGKVINVKGTPGAANLTGGQIAVATDKGWTVTTS